MHTFDVILIVTVFHVCLRNSGQRKNIRIEVHIVPVDSSQLAAAVIVIFYQRIVVNILLAMPL
jgi:hypothetical protein